ncbi:uroporphyrinogen decarboxylase [Orientia chuto str. Dubai]|uniref:Uroporphyrinogen decarboxylase n=1 Tax=Orientia chuto str. Dubai TaxID=1359168 RepID=A0A0F3MKY6_9RICK|nr:uroporphyrinogen decarboxylase [Candidatus Orientia mediorientalis]KJV56107.1 uroporphyrinogen decarboxylase [Orientia chuto str. Dubai]
MKKIIKAFNNSKKIYTPIWFMRQAGRYLPEYRIVRKTVNNFLELCYNPHKAAEITLQPIKRFNLDAAIIFSDILVLPNSLGIEIKFINNLGPTVEKIPHLLDLKMQKVQSNKINKVCEAISIVKQKLEREKSIIGFCGGPWTVLTYILGYNSKNIPNFYEINVNNKQKTLLELVNILTKHTIDYLVKQILAGVDIVQIFDSWAGILPKKEFYEYVIKPTSIIVKTLKEKFPYIKIIGFPKGAGNLYHEYVKKTRVDGVSCDHKLPLEEMLELQKNVLVQGNLDPSIMLSEDSTVIENSVKKIMDYFSRGRFIFNLGHGILPATPIKNVELVVKLVKNYHFSE